MFKRNVLAVSMVVAGLCSAQAMAAVVGGGATLPQGLYGVPDTGSVAAADGILNGASPLAGFDNYVGIGSGGGKTSFLTNNSNLLVWDVDGVSTTAPTQVYPTAVTVDYAGSDSILSATELSTYRAAHQSPAVPTTSAANWGPIIQIPAEATSVTVPYKKTGVTTLNLTSAQLCGIFAGTITDWSAISSASGPITVVYRSGSSGTSEIFTRHLNSQCSGQFGVSSTFTSAAVGGVPAGAVAVASSPLMASTVASTEGAIGYVGPEDVNATSNAVVARVNGNLPTVGNVTTALSTIAPPAVADRGLPENWAKVLPNPTSGYSIVGYTFLNFNQCYKDSTDTSKIRAFIDRHYTVNDASNNDNAIIAAKLIPVTDTWKVAIRNTFWTSTNSLSVGNTTACNGIGRPL